MSSRSKWASLAQDLARGDCRRRFAGCRSSICECDVINQRALADDQPMDLIKPQMVMIECGREARDTQGLRFGRLFQARQSTKG
jgi:hypothetical protein